MDKNSVKIKIELLSNKVKQKFYQENRARVLQLKNKTSSKVLS